MIAHDLTAAVRHLRRHWGCTLIHVAGLAAGMAAGLLILLWIRAECGYDRFHRAIDRIYLVPSWMQYGARRGFSDGAPPALAPALAAECPEVARAVRWHRGDRWVVQSEKIATKEQVRLVDPAFFEMFSFGLLQGNAATVFADPFSIVLTESAARRHFGRDAPLGHLVRCNYAHDLRVTGVIADPPPSSSLVFDALAPLELLRYIQSSPQYLDTWHNCEFMTFVELRGEKETRGGDPRKTGARFRAGLRERSRADARALAAKIGGRVKAADPNSIITPFLFPFRDYHLHSMRGPGGRIETVRGIALVAGLVLLIACVNFMNLATARASTRAREVGVRKAVGAARGQLVVQFYTEAFLQVFLALGLALLVARGLLPLFREITGAGIAGNLGRDPLVLAGAPLLGIVAGLVAGGYPAFVLSSFQPAGTLRGGSSSSGRGVWLRRGLVVAQFAATVVLLVVTVVIHEQHRFMRDKDPGFEGENLVSFPLDREVDRQFDAFRNALLEHPDVMAVTRATHSPVGIYWNGSGWDWAGRDPAVDPFVTYVAVDLDYLDAMGMTLTAGSFFSRPRGAGHQDEVVVNESFARLLGGETAVGARLYARDDGDSASRRPLTVIGVVKDFHFRPVTDPIGPLMMLYDHPVPDVLPWSAFVRLRPEAASTTLAHIERVYHRFAPGRMFDARIVADECARRYGDVQSAGTILGAFALLALGISCLGLFGLASFMTGQRRREIGIRKALGAPAIRVGAMLVGDFARWVALANLIALPVAALLAGRWLTGFAYRIDLGPGPFLLAGGLSLLVAVLAVGGQAGRAARADPVSALRCD
jgi:putative ABC transport system permease protein